jgi:hypothetical protein
MDTLQAYTPSFVPTTSFGIMTQEKRDTLSIIADIAQKAADVAQVIRAPSGSRLDSLTPPPSARTPFGISNLIGNSLLTNPLFIAGAAVAIVLILKK